MTLLETQRRFAGALMLPLTAGDRMAKQASSGLPMEDEAAAFIKPNSRMSPLERLEIYGRSYWLRLLDSFREDFPGLAAILGARAFERMARAYLAECPSRSFTLRDLGSRLEAWLTNRPGFAARKVELALDMVRLEWAQIVAFDGPAEKVLGPEDLAELKPGLRFGLQPYISLLELHYPVDELRLKTNAGDRNQAAASNTPTERARYATARVGRPCRQQLFLAVHRFELSVYYRRLTAEQFRLLCALCSGAPIAAAIGSAFLGSSVSEEEAQQLLKEWFSLWTQLGWLTPRQKAKRRSRA